MHWVDYLIIFAFIAYAIQNGIRSRKAASKNPEEYFLAGRTLPGWKAGLSMAATQFAADTPLLVTGMIAVSGIFAVWRLWVYGVAFLVLGFILAGSWQRAGVITDAELTELRYGKKPAAVLRGFKAIYFGTIFNCTVLAMVLLASTRIAEPFLTWDQWLPSIVYDPVRSLVDWVGADFTHLDPKNPDFLTNSTNNLFSILAILLVTLGYSATGGLRSVVMTDVVQLGVITLATFFYAWYVVREVGGLWSIPEQIREKFGSGGGPGGISANEILAFTPSRAHEAGAAILIVYATQWFFQINADGTGYLAQRAMACRSPRDARIAALTLTFVQIFVRSLLWLPIGLGLLLIVDTDVPSSAALAEIKAAREFAFVEGFKQLLPTGLLGLMLTGMLAALASTVDTHLNWGSSYWTNDIVKRYVYEMYLKRDPDPRLMVWVARGAYLCILLIALAIMTIMPSIRDAWQASLLLGAGIGPILVLRWLWWRINAWGEIAATIASLVLIAPLLLWVDGTWVRMLIMGGVASTIGIAVALFVGAEDESDLREFYGRARPPGFWGPIAEAEGDEPAGPRGRLWRGAVAVATSTVSVFSLLTGIGSWLCGSPPPTWFPYRTPWLITLVVVGIGLIPVWYRFGFADTSGEPRRTPPEHPERSEATERQTQAQKEETGEGAEDEGTAEQSESAQRR